MQLAAEGLAQLLKFARLQPHFEKFALHEACWKRARLESHKTGSFESIRRARSQISFFLS